MRLIVILLALLACSPALAAWREAETDHFVITSDGDEKAFVKFAERLESFHHLLKLATNTTATPRRIVKLRVFLVNSVDDVQRRIGRPGSGVAGYYDTREDGAIAVVPRNAGNDGSFTGQLVLFHEYAHHFMLQYSPSVYPAWYVEGFAEIASTASFERKGSITFGKAAQHRQGELFYLKRYPVSKMVDGSYLEEKRQDESWSYGDAWLLSHYLTFSDARRGQLRAYLAAINAGKSFPEAAKAFGDLQTLQREVSIYLSGASFSFRAVPLPEAKPDAVKLRTISPAEADLIDETIELERRTRVYSAPSPEKDDPKADPAKRAERKAEEEAQAKRAAESLTARTAWLAGLATKANQYASDPAGWRLLADAQCQSEDATACAAAANRVLALSPQDSRAKLRKAEALLVLAKDKDEAPANADVKAARTLIVEANRADPDDPLPLLAFYKSYG